MRDTTHLLLRIAGVCSILAPSVMLAADSVLLLTGWRFEWTIILWIAFVLFVPAIFGLTYLLASRGSRLAVVGGASAFFGCMVGASMQAIFRVYAVLDEIGSSQTVSLLQSTPKLTATYRMIGGFFPLGLLILAACLYRARVVNPLVPLSLAIGAILFPIGRVTGLMVAMIGSDLLLTAAFVIIGIRLLSAKQPAAAEGVAARPAA